MSEANDNHPEVGAPLPPKVVTQDRIEKAITELLLGLGQQDKEEVMRNTPRRVAEMYGDVINAPWCDIEIPWKCFPNPGVTDLIIVTDCHYVTMCEHHLAPSLGVAHFAYVPDELITGYSKVKKALNYLSRQPQLNERLLVDAMNALESVLQPKGVGLVLHSIHMCLACKSNGPSQEIVTVMDFRGVLKEDPYRRDFLAAAQSRKPMFTG